MTLAGVTAVVALTSCTVAPNPPDFGYRMEGGVLVVAFPRCPAESIVGAAVVVSVRDEGRGDGFEDLWRAEKPVRREVREGRFFVANSTSFRDVEQPLRGVLPKVFFVEVSFTGADGKVKVRTGVVKLGALKGTELRDGQYMTWDQEVPKAMTRQQIDAQRKCRP
ncbi:hypothetical protein [Streptomyces laurentii]|uniref:hypothetical protein n=1 Tax=Streptomyces laurentii TaxID=39478 RepID=UPI00367C3C91